MAVMYCTVTGLPPPAEPGVFLTRVKVSLAFHFVGTVFSTVGVIMSRFEDTRMAGGRTDGTSAESHGEDSGEKDENVVTVQGYCTHCIHCQGARGLDEKQFNAVSEPTKTRTDGMGVGSQT